jgi:hypothetical protein
MHSPGKTSWILGLNFFSNYYTVFDYSTQKIGFAKSINYLKPASKSFINWATSGSHLMNLVATHSKSIVYTWVFVVSWALFMVYYCVIKRQTAK